MSGRWGGVLLCLCVAACDDGATGGGGGGGGGREAGVDLDRGGGFPMFDAALPFDGRVQRDGEAGSFGAPCFDNLDCESGFCVPYENRNVCTIRCLDEGCPAGWGCRVVANTLPDAVSVCLPPNNRLCALCEADADCPDGRCITVDGARVCGLDCVGDESCPPQYACLEVGADQPKQCVPRTQSCTCDVNRAGQQRVCEVRNDVGACFGRETCDAEAGWGGCTAATPSAEVCNQLDDDCNGFTDDIPGLGDVCERVAEIEGESRACTGRLVCTRETVEPVCTAIEPTAERCNFLDDDCDGEADEDFPDRGTVCVVGEGACRRVGVGECAEDEASVACNVVAGEPVPERCDSLDNDCDGQTDEDFPGLSDPCFAGVGACRRAGALRCDGMGEGAECTAVAGQPAAETCDGIDNDCDGTNDEGYEGLFEPCAVGVGGCRRQGFLYCTDAGDAVACTALPSDPVEERCNGVDDDCDGTQDEGFPGLNTPCSRGEGLCQRAGVSVCSADGSRVECNAPNADPTPERCDGLDNDCDGDVDEIFPDLDIVCAEGVGACQRIGLVACTPDGAATACTARPVPPAPERCDGLDNDCNGQTDEGFANLGTACSVGVGACEARGVVRCSADGAAARCDAVARMPAAEVCDGLDNDCDGRLDEGFMGLNAPCSDGEGACRVAGVGVCSPDRRSVVCSVTAGDGSPEVCDGIDNDCNGTIDDPFPNLGRPCEAGRGVCRQAGVFECAAGGAGTVCNARPGAPTPEACDGLDNDCDGTVDNGFAGLNAPCSAGQGVCQRPGVGVCALDGAAVICNAMPGPAGAERCDALDNDCDGRSDEGFAGLNTACQAGVGACRRAGVQVCSADGAQVICDAQAGAPGAETCDAQDNDCDGRTDEAFADLNTACQAGTGVCRRAGVQVCSPDGQGLVCTAEAGMPIAERCDALDNDCDGRSDEGFAGLNTACQVGVGLCRRAGVQVCSADGAAVVCNAQAGMAAAESCDAQDNDCDGRTDEGFAGLGTACSAGVGLCRTAGVQVCSADGARVVCDAQAGMPVAETCDAQDNDCDNRTDEGFAGLGTACQIGTGACQRAGVQVCAANGAGVECNAQAGAPAAETCDAVDNDCDGRIDEGFANLGTACQAGTGVCQRAGVNVCSADGARVTCNAQPAQPGAEACDALDNDCDGRTDEGFAGLGTACSAGVGQCRDVGVQVCSADGARVVCDAQPGQPAAERCDAVDNDCDNRTDEGFANLGTACQAGTGTCQRAGVHVCSADGGQVICNAQPGQPGAERCDALDNDCDARTDEGFANLGTACQAGTGVCQRAGVNVCSADGAQVVCNAQAGQPGAERCDALDNDCDTRTDEGFANLGTACVAGTGACQRAGVQVCDAAGGGVICNAAPGGPAAELCDSIDNDCDARTDETFANLGRVCTTGQGLCRRSGVFVCAANPAAQPVCDAPVVGGAAQEACDYQDDDCDGRTDEAFVDANGRYVQLAHCGACGNDCTALWDPNPAAFGVAPRCSVVAGLAQCDFACLAGFLDADGIANNGCELQIDGGAVYVSTPANGGADAAACGTVQAPCATITFGLQRAQTLGRARVRVSDGSYQESVTLLNGISLLGGHHRTTWLRDPLLNVTIINGRSQEPVHRRTVSAIGINQDTTLDGFVINGESPLATGNSYAVYIRDSNSRLRVTNNRIQAGDGGRGDSGPLGGSGQVGTPGVAGLNSFGTRSPDACTPDPGAGFIRSAGGAGGQRVCGAVAVHGGAGGGARCPADERQEGSGAVGQTARGGAGGPGAWGLTSPNNNTCTVSAGGPADASPGRAGAAGTDGNGGGGAAAGIGQVAANEWRGNAALVGGTGLPGGGGGGGGAAAGVDILWTAFEAWDIGATGGGGGSGGCQGNGGGPGAWGGGSFGIFVTFTGAGPAAAADLPTLENNEIARALGGAGGDGGNGGAGGEGGAGAAGGARGAGLRMAFCSFQGASGGQGGRGGHGGGGGGGQGGASYDIFINNDNNVANPYLARNQFALPANVNTAGPGGEGGVSLNTATGLGSPGAAGPFGNLGRLP